MTDLLKNRQEQDGKFHLIPRVRHYANYGGIVCILPAGLILFAVSSIHLPVHRLRLYVAHYAHTVHGWRLSRSY